MEVAVVRVRVERVEHNKTWWRCENPCLSIFENLNILPFILDAVTEAFLFTQQDENMQSISKRVAWSRKCMEIKTLRQSNKKLFISWWFKKIVSLKLLKICSKKNHITCRLYFIFSFFRIRTLEYFCYSQFLCTNLKVQCNFFHDKKYKIKLLSNFILTFFFLIKFKTWHTIPHPPL